MNYNNDYKTIAGTKFYDRNMEVNFLINQINRSSYTIVWGPRNIGKSELLRYISWKLRRNNIFTYYIDVRKYLSKKHIEIFFNKLNIKEIMSSLSNLIGIPNRILELFEIGVKIALEKKCNGILWIIDEPHYLSNAKPFLEASIKEVLYKFHEKPIPIIIVVSEGWFILSDITWSLINYGAKQLLVNWMDKKYFKAFTREIMEIRNANLNIDFNDLYNNYVGGVPGALISLIEYGLNDWIKLMESYLIRACRNVADRLNINLN